ncbi:MAG: flagellar hook-associated protein FlgK [Paracoccaceae bacterium]
MSLSSTLSSALSGLTAAARGAEVVSANVANATTEGYGRRELTLASQSVGHVGAGVRVVGVERQVDLALLSDRRIAEASHAGVAVEGEFLSRLETAYGTPDQANSLSGLIAGFERALIEAASRPDSEARLSNVAETARQMVAKINAVGRTIQQARGEADAAIAGQVAELNTTLAQIAELNGQIRAYSGGNRDASALIDQRQQLIDRIAAAVPLREVSRDHDQIALYTTGGAILLDGRPAELGFTPSNRITPDMAVGGALSGLTINGNPVTTSGATGPIAGGALAANFALRDALAPTAQTRLDALARDLVERMADPAVDPTLTPGDPGLFTDAGAAFLAADEVGLAQRLRLNALADPVAGGALWRLRDGLGATAQGPVGNAAG